MAWLPSAGKTRDFTALGLFAKGQVDGPRRLTEASARGEKSHACNDAFVRMFGLKGADEACGRPVSDFAKDGAGYRVVTADDVHGRKTVGTVGSILKD